MSLTLKQLQSMLKDISSMKDKLEMAISKKGGKTKKSSSSDDECGSVASTKSKRESTNPWLKWTKYCKETFTEEYNDFASKQGTKQGIVPKFASYCRDDIKASEYRDFIIALTGEEPKPKQVRKMKKSDDDEEKPKKVAKKSKDDDDEVEKPKAAASASKKTSKKTKDEEAEEKPKKTATKKSSKKAKDEEAEPEEKKPMSLKKFKLDGASYLRDKETNLCYTLTEENAPGECVGIYDAASNIINPVSADDDI